MPERMDYEHSSPGVPKTLGKAVGTLLELRRQHLYEFSLVRDELDDHVNHSLGLTQKDLDAIQFDLGATNDDADDDSTTKDAEIEEAAGNALGELRATDLGAEFAAVIVLRSIGHRWPKQI